MNNDTFQWTDELAQEACWYVGLNISNKEDIQRQIPELIDKFKQSKMPKMKIEPSYILLRNLPNISKKTPIYLSIGGDSYTCKDKFGGNATLNKKLVETNPEWFEMQPQTATPHRLSDREPKKEWEIVAFIEKSKDRILYKQTDGRFLGSGAVFGAAEKDLLNNSSYPIHSVRRLSDNEVFTVGDEVEYRSADASDWGDICGYGKINWFKISLVYESNMEVEINDEHRWRDAYFPHKYIENIRHKKEQPKKERIEVVVEHTSDCRVQSVAYMGNDIPEGKFPAIKAAIERVLNDEPDTFDYPKAFAIMYNDEAERKIKEVEEKAFNAAREILAKDTHPRYTMEKYTTFQDYINHQRDKK